MKSMKRNEWIAVAVGILVVGFFLFGGSVMNLFNETQSQVTLGQSQPEARTGLQIQDVVVGTGAVATNGNLLTVHYIGALANGQVFDSSMQRSEPFQFILGAGQVIDGWERGLQGMKVGGKRRILIPPAMGYGDNQVGPIPPNSVLIFEVELLNVSTPQE